MLMMVPPKQAFSFPFAQPTETSTMLPLLLLWSWYDMMTYQMLLPIYALFLEARWYVLYANRHTVRALYERGEGDARWVRSSVELISWIVYYFFQSTVWDVERNVYICGFLINGWAIATDVTFVSRRMSSSIDNCQFGGKNTTFACPTEGHADILEVTQITFPCMQFSSEQVIVNFHGHPWLFSKFTASILFIRCYLHRRRSDDEPFPRLHRVWKNESWTSEVVSLFGVNKPLSSYISVGLCNTFLSRRIQSCKPTSIKELSIAPDACSINDQTAGLPAAQ